jgi:hypothetical protein
MKSIRLNDMLRSQIVDNALETIPELSKKDIKEKQKKYIEKWGDRVYNALYPANICRRMKNMPEGAFQMANNINFHLQVDNGKINRERVTVAWSEKRPLFHKHSSQHWCRHDELPEGIDADELWQDFKQVDEYEINRARREKEFELMRFLKQFTTTKQLLEAWPEGSAFVPKPDSKSPTKALVVRADNVNKLLGLKS